MQKLFIVTVLVGALFLLHQQDALATHKKNKVATVQKHLTPTEKTIDFNDSASAAHQYNEREILRLDSFEAPEEHVFELLPGQRFYVPEEE